MSDAEVGGRKVIDPAGIFSNGQFQSVEKNPEQFSQQQRDPLLARLEQSQSLLDRETYQELKSQVTGATNFSGLAGFEDKLSQAKEGLGIFGVRRKNEEFAKMIGSKPGVARQTVLTSGQNTTGVGSLGLFKQQGR